MLQQHEVSVGNLRKIATLKQQRVPDYVDPKIRKAEIEALDKDILAELREVRTRLANTEKDQASKTEMNFLRMPRRKAKRTKGSQIFENSRLRKSSYKPIIR